MKVFLEFEIGNGTCAIGPGTFCRFCCVSNFGTKYSCSLFLYDRENATLNDNDLGWLERCPACMEAFPKEADQ